MRIEGAILAKKFILCGAQTHDPQSDALPTELDLVVYLQINERAARMFLGVTATSGHTLCSKTIIRKILSSARV